MATFIICGEMKVDSTSHLLVFIGQLVALLLDYVVSKIIFCVQTFGIISKYNYKEDGIRKKEKWVHTQNKNKNICI